MYNEEGETTWERSLDSNGKVKTGDNSNCPFLFQGQYYDAEIELAYNRFRYYDPEDGRYISKDPIGLLSGEFGFYNYVGDSNGWVDVFGLSSYNNKKLTKEHKVYVLKKNGKAVYIGITIQDPKARKSQHKNGTKNKDGSYKVEPKVFDEMHLVAEVDTRRDSRNIEGSALRHKKEMNLQNKRRKDGGFWHSYPKNPEGGGRVLMKMSEIDKILGNTIKII
ncbi:RHS repeat-associated core domain-containing protein (plasmid) [Tenacibaculum finnmarkense]|nr:RHS repeat-associated core domain-containing protein [Tenacibaculum finnmarkense]